MLTDVMPEKAQSAAESLLRLIRQHIPTDGEAGDVEAFAVLASILADLIGTVWNRFLSKLQDGMNAEPTRTQGAAISIAANLHSEAIQLIQKEGEEVARRVGEPIKGLSELVSGMGRMLDIERAARRVVDSVNGANCSSIDQSMLKQSEADFSAGRFQKGKDVIARLRSCQ